LFWAEGGIAGFKFEFPCFFPVNSITAAVSVSGLFLIVNRRAYSRRSMGAGRGSRGSASEIRSAEARIRTGEVVDGSKMRTPEATWKEPTARVPSFASGGGRHHGARRPQAPRCRLAPAARVRSSNTEPTVILVLLEQSVRGSRSSVPPPRHVLLDRYRR
jgi:hypothetical protein